VKDVKSNKEEEVITRNGDEMDEVSKADITKELIPKFQVRYTNIITFR
jgi:hypothetical protein